MFLLLIRSKALCFIRRLMILGAAFFGLLNQAYAHPLEQTEGLKRFSRQQTLSAPTNPKQTLQSSLDIKEVKLGQNILDKAIALIENGGEIHTITGGTRSEKITVSFFQPYQESRLEQRLELYFNKHSGFIHQLNLRYKISSAYLSIEPVRTQVLEAAIAKYGKPLSMQDVRTLSKQTKGEVKLAKFADALQDNSPAAVTFFKKMSFARNAQISQDNQNLALFPAGFDQCYVWPQDNFNELLTFCAFAPNAANAANRGLEFSLLNFSIAETIIEQEHLNKASTPLSL